MTYESKVLSNKALTDLETKYIKFFDMTELYNIKSEAASSIGYRHTEEAKLKMKEFYKDKNNHPMFGKNHTKEALSLIAKPGKLNPMFGKHHSEESKKIIALKQSKYINGVGIFDLEDNLLHKFTNNVELAKHLNISKVTVGKYLNNNLVYQNKFKFKPIS